MTISKHVVAAELNVGEGHDLDVINGKITLDDAWSPYAQSELTIYTPAEEVLDLLDPRDSVRVVVTVTKEFSDWNPSSAFIDQERVFNLLLRSREVDHVTGTTSISLASDEAQLQDYALVDTDPDRIYGLSVKDAVEYALGKVSAMLEAGAADADIESDDLPPTVTNLAPSPIANLTRNWTGHASTTDSLLTSAYGDSPALRSTRTTSSGAWATYLSRDTQPTLVDGETYTVRAMVRSSVSKTGCAIRTHAGVTLPTIDTASFDMVAGEWVEATLTFTAATANMPYTFSILRTADASGTTLDVAELLIVQSDVDLEYFDGSTTDTDFIDYAWTGTTNNSASTRTYVPNSDAMIWQPGVTAWDWLEPLLQVTGLRLYCDEDRKWWLETAGTPRDGVITISAERNATQASDKISRTSDSWFDAVVIGYTRNVDENGKAFTVYDATDPGTLALKLEYDRPYPGAGAAASILARAQGRGRVLRLESISNYDATPGMALTATLPDSPIQTGVISSAEWSFPDDRMTIGSRGLTDTPESSWLFATEGHAWEDETVGTDWTEYTP